MRPPLGKKIKIKNLQSIVQSIKELYQNKRKKEKNKQKIKLIINVMPVCLCTQDLKLCMVYNYIWSK